MSSLHEYMEDLARQEGPSLASQVAAAPRQVAPVSPAAAAGSPADPPIGRIFDERYELVRLLGRDKLAATYEVRHLRLGKRFTMKVIHAALVGDPQLRQTFERGAHATSRLSFPNCMSVTDFGQTEEGELYLVTEFLEGAPLSTLLERLLPLGMALEITRQILLGLDHAHQAGVLHLALSGESVLLTRADGQWRVKIVDFAVSRLSGQAERIAEGAADQVRSPEGPCLAPEQRSGGPADGRADLYAVGVMLWQMITGRLPPQDDEGGQRAPQLERVAPRAFSPELQALVGRALAPDPAGRFASAGEMLAALALIVQQQGRGLAPPEQGRGRLAAQLRSRRGVLVLGGTTLLLLAVALALLLTPLTGQRRTPSGGSDARGALAAAAGALDRAGAQRAAPPAPRRVQALIRRGACAAARRRLATLSTPEQAHPQALLLSGAAHCCQKAYDSCLEAYGQAVAADSALQFSALLLQDLRRLLRVPQQTEAVLIFAVERMGEPGQALVIDAASNHRTLQVRHQAASVARQRGLEDRVDWVASRSLDLSQQTDCAAKRQAIADLRALGDPRAIKALERVRSKRVWVDRVGYSGWQERHSCVSKEAEQAIAFLRQR